MNEAQKKALKQLRDAGYAVMVFAPEEFDGYEAGDLEDAMLYGAYAMIANEGGPL